MSYEISVIVGNSQNVLLTPKCFYEFKTFFFLANFVSFCKYFIVKYYSCFFIYMVNCIPLMTFLCM